MARLEKLGAFTPTEPNHDSDSVALETPARRDGDRFVINGAKRWIGNGSPPHLVVWARGEDGKVTAFLPETGPARWRGPLTGHAAGGSTSRSRPPQLTNLDRAATHQA